MEIMFIVIANPFILSRPPLWTSVILPSNFPPQSALNRNYDESVNFRGTVEHLLKHFLHKAVFVLRNFENSPTTNLNEKWKTSQQNAFQFHFNPLLLQKTREQANAAATNDSSRVNFQTFDNFI